MEAHIGQGVDPFDCQMVDLGSFVSQAVAYYSATLDGMMALEVHGAMVLVKAFEMRNLNLVQKETVTVLLVVDEAGK